MNSATFPRGAIKLRTAVFALRPTYPQACSRRAASLNTAIGRGNRRSESLAKRRGGEQEGRGDYKPIGERIRGPPDGGNDRGNAVRGKEAWSGRSDDKRTEEKTGGRTRGRERSPMGRNGKGYDEKLPAEKRFDFARTPNFPTKSNPSVGCDKGRVKAQPAGDAAQEAQSKREDAPRGGNRGSGKFGALPQEYQSRDSTDSWKEKSQLKGRDDVPRSRDGGSKIQYYGSDWKDKYGDLVDQGAPTKVNPSLEPITRRRDMPYKEDREIESRIRRGKKDIRLDKPEKYARPDLDSEMAPRKERSARPWEEKPGPLTPPPMKHTQEEFNSMDKDLILDRHMPITIPYTTPASEFLYGTSVVRAALTSRRVPRRKHYKLYIYTGLNREHGERDLELEKLARKSGVEVLLVKGHWNRVMDKMSGGRPHNGYILEASPLPRLPVTSLGALTTQGGEAGFSLEIDHQSREEALINGTFNFYSTPPSSRNSKPLVLLLDGIVDPGNLGAIIRTASFLGVTAVAIAVGKSATFTPTVLKASAGAAENITLFSVRKPRGFITDSQANGWKVYAAVAPPAASGRLDPWVKSAMSVDELRDPLRDSPCILMLGSEGEGLRAALKMKADVELCIKGAEGSVDSGVDSLNVSVATGILCSSFLRAKAELDVSTTVGGAHQVMGGGEGNEVIEEKKKDLF